MQQIKGLFEGLDMQQQEEILRDCYKTSKAGKIIDDFDKEHKEKYRKDTSYEVVISDELDVIKIKLHTGAGDYIGHGATEDGAQADACIKARKGFI